LSKNPHQFKTVYPKRLGPGAALLLLLSLLWGACGGSETTSNLPTALPNITAAVQLPPVSIAVGNGNSPTAAVSSDLTATPVIAPTPTQDSNYPTVSQPPTATIPPVTPTGVAQITPTPAVSGPLEAIDRTAELATIKAGFDAINKHLFKQPDTKALLEASLKEIANVSGATVPELTFGSDAEANWDIFAATFDKMLNAAGDFKYPKYQLARRVVNVMADTVGDEHTYFMDPASYQSRQNLLSGNNASIGFGVVITTQVDKAYIVRVVPGSPADKAGVKEGDQF
jgi:hypothetical protein